MDTSLNTKKYRDDGYHIRRFDKKAQRLAKAGASIAGVDIGTWIAQAVKEKFNRDIVNKKPAPEHSEVKGDERRDRL